MAISGSVDITPGKQFSAGELQTRSKLNLLGKPIARVAAGGIGTRELSASAVKSLIPGVNRNYLINGNFDIWQRGGFTNSVNLPTLLGTTALKEYGADHWLLGTPSGATKREISRQSFTLGQTSVPFYPTFYMKWAQTVAQTLPTLSQPIEDVRTLAGQNVVVTWWMKADSGISVTCRLRQYFGDTPGSSNTVAATTGGTCTLTGGAQWIKFTTTFTVPVLTGQTEGSSGWGTFGTVANSCLVLEFVMPSATVFNCYFAQVQLEAGVTPTDYEVRSALLEQSRCERYFEITAGVMAPVDVFTLAIPVDLVSITGAGDVLTNYAPGFAFRLLSWHFVVTKPVTTAAKAVTLNLEIGTTNVTAGLLSLTSATCTPLGASISVVSSIGAPNTGLISDNFSVEASSVTAFSEGQGVLFIRIQRTDMVVPTVYFATRKYRSATLTLLTGYAGSGGAFTSLLDVGYYQTTANTLFSTYYLTAEAEIL